LFSDQDDVQKYPFIMPEFFSEIFLKILLIYSIMIFEVNNIRCEFWMFKDLFFWGLSTE